MSNLLRRRERERGFVGTDRLFRAVRVAVDAGQVDVRVVRRRAQRRRLEREIEEVLGLVEAAGARPGTER